MSKHIAKDKKKGMKFWNIKGGSHTAEQDH